jgi:hypothetical protein
MEGYLALQMVMNSARMREVLMDSTTDFHSVPLLALSLGHPKELLWAQ